MLSVNRILIFLFITIFSSSLYAVDVSKFDIKGIKLGMSKNEVLKKMPCSSPKISLGKWGKLGKSEDLLCNNDKNDFRVALDHKGYSCDITFDVKFKVKPNFNKLEARLIKKYGKTKYKSNSYDLSKPSRKFRSLCWGVCSITDSVGGDVVYYVDGTSGLSANFDITDNDNEYRMDLSLSDGERNKNMKKYYYEIKERKKRKEKASNIDF